MRCYARFHFRFDFRFSFSEPISVFDFGYIAVASTLDVLLWRTYGRTGVRAYGRTYGRTAGRYGRTGVRAYVRAYVSMCAASPCGQEGLVEFWFLNCRFVCNLCIEAKKGWWIAGRVALVRISPHVVCRRACRTSHMPCRTVCCRACRTYPHFTARRLFCESSFWSMAPKKTLLAAALAAGPEAAAKRRRKEQQHDSVLRKAREAKRRNSDETVERGIDEHFPDFTGHDRTEILVDGKNLEDHVKEELYRVRKWNGRIGPLFWSDATRKFKKAQGGGAEADPLTVQNHDMPNGDDLKLCSRLSTTEHQTLETTNC